MLNEKSRLETHALTQEETSHVELQGTPVFLYPSISLLNEVGSQDLKQA